MENLNELIPIQENNGKKAVSARALYEFLGYNKAVWKRWYEKNILNNAYAEESVDWGGFNIELNGNETMDFALSIKFAKKLCKKRDVYISKVNDVRWGNVSVYPDDILDEVFSGN